MTAFAHVIYELGEIRDKLPALYRPTIDRACSELVRLQRECCMLERSIERDRMPTHIANLNDCL